MSYELRVKPISKEMGFLLLIIASLRGAKKICVWLATWQSPEDIAAVDSSALPSIVRERFYPGVTMEYPCYIHKVSSLIIAAKVDKTGINGTCALIGVKYFTSCMYGKTNWR